MAERVKIPALNVRVKWRRRSESAARRRKTALKGVG